jgi:5-formyltetrahydrofolate cyclo-ligase
MSQPVVEQKTALRRRWKARLAAGFSRDPAKNAKLCERLAEDPVFRNARKIALYCPRDWEVDPRPLWNLRPEHCYFPRVVPNTSTMEFYSIASLDSFVVGFGRIGEPPPDPPRLAGEWTREDLILVPGVYFDAKGHRLGSGLGFYDRFLSGTGALSWGICWEEQFLIGENLLTLPHDVAVRRVVTDVNSHLISNI